MIPFTMLSIIQSISFIFSMEIQIAIKMDFLLLFFSGLFFVAICWQKIVELKDFFVL